MRLSFEISSDSYSISLTNRQIYAGNCKLNGWFNKTNKWLCKVDDHDHQHFPVGNNIAAGNLIIEISNFCIKIHSNIHMLQELPLISSE